MLVMLPTMILTVSKIIISRGDKGWWWWYHCFYAVEEKYIIRHQIFETHMISADNVGLIWFGNLPRLPLIWMKSPLRVFTEREIRYLSTNYSDGGEIISMQYWHNLKSLHLLCRRQKKWAAVLFVISFFASSFYLILPATILNCATFSLLEYILEFKLWLFLVDIYSS